MPRVIAPSILAICAVLWGTALAAEPQPSTSLDASIRDAQQKRSQKDLTGAVKVLSQLMLVAPDDARVVGEYGKVLVQQGRAREALDFLQRAVQLQANDWTLYSALGVAYDQAGDYASARAAYERALQIKPGEAVVLNNFAMSRTLAGDLDKARQLIADASFTSKDERIKRNLDTIYSLKLPAVAKSAPPAPAHGIATGAPRTLTPSEGRSIVTQALPDAAKTATVAKAGKPGTAKGKAALAAKKPVDAIPSLRLANDRQ